jgi:hypothetical protein
MINLNFEFTGWDALLLVAVSLMGAAVAYVHHPRRKALILSLPIPFTAVVLSQGHGVNATHVLGLLLLLLYTYGVRFLYVKLRLPIVLSIALSAGGYAVAGVVLARHVPATPAAFWIAAGAVFLLAAVLHGFVPHREEPGHRTPLPVWIKLPIIVAVVAALIISKKMLQGFMATFPMVSLLAAYEARHSLWTVCRAIPALTLCMLPMFAVMHIAEPRIGLAGALVAGWLVYLSLLIPLMRRQRREWEEPDA